MTQLAQNIQISNLKIIQMSKVKNTQTSDSKNPQSIDRSLLEFLKPKAEERYSKLEAYCDLLSRASSGAYTAASSDKKQELLPGQFIATISELARKWQWQRATVRQFIEGLVTLGQITTEPISKKFIFTVNLQRRLSLFVETADDILDFCAMQFIRFIQGRTSAAEVAESYGKYYGMKMEIALDEGNGGIPVKRVIQHQALMFNELATSIFRVLKRNDNVPQELSDSVTLLFGRDHVWDWHKVIDCLGILAVALRDNVKPSYMNEVNEHFTKAEVTLLDCIFEHYAADAGSTYYDNPPKLSEKTSDSEKEVRTEDLPGDKAEAE